MNLNIISYQIADSIDIKLFKTAFPAHIHYGYSETGMTAFFQTIGPYQEKFKMTYSPFLNRVLI
jgi:hypothetical protein